VFHTVTQFDSATLEQRLRELAALTPGLRVVLQDERAPGSQPQVMRFPNGLADLVRHLDSSRRPLMEAPIVIKGEKDGIGVEVSLWWNDTHREQVLCFTNALRQRDGGTHLAGLRSALGRVFATRAQESCIADRERVPIAAEDARSGLTAALAVWMLDPRFADWSKSKLVSPEMKAIVESIVTEQLTAWLDAHPGQAKAILAMARRAASAHAICHFTLRPPTGRA
jgi:DNA gyrase subunit B